MVENMTGKKSVNKRYRNTDRMTLNFQNDPEKIVEMRGGDAQGEASSIHHRTDCPSLFSVFGFIYKICSETFQLEVEDRTELNLHT